MSVYDMMSKCYDSACQTLQGFWFRQTDKHTIEIIYRGWSTVLLRKQLPPPEVDASAIYTRASVYQQQRMRKVIIASRLAAAYRCCITSISGCQTGQMKWRAWCGLELIGSRRSATIGRRKSRKRHRRRQYIHHLSGSVSPLSLA